ncbi:MAG: FAD-dependent oxidoreductase [Pseudomonadales bacterium]|nr:FAD-dependent oxidoreductase [Pseudomonadales bacterium]
MNRRDLSVDAAIVGGGISGLWIANLLVGRGLSVVICEPRGVGGVQTLASQGIVHSGAKYGRDGTPPLSGALKAMPDRWRACLRGEGEIDLRGVRVLSQEMRFRIGDEALKLDELVLDTVSLVRRLAAPVADRVVAQAVGPESLIVDESGVARLEVADCTILAGTYVFTAGAGNAALAQHAGFARTALRHRPLRQTIVRLRRDAKVYAHWAASDREAEPTLTVTSDGPVMSIGGKVADAGVQRAEAAQIERVRELLHEGFPDIDLDGADFETFAAVRAEPDAKTLRDVPDAFVAHQGNCLLCLPVKLSLAPRLGDLVRAELGDLEPAQAAWAGDPNRRVVYATSPYTHTPC